VAIGKLPAGHCARGGCPRDARRDACDSASRQLGADLQRQVNLLVSLDVAIERSDDLSASSPALMFLRASASSTGIAWVRASVVAAMGIAW
jgi:hypothetical protein